MKLVSILNSGESLEKSIVLSYLAVKDNFSFYDDFKSIIVFFDENLPKKYSTLPAHGSLSAILNYIGNRKIIPYVSMEEVWDDRFNVINSLVYSKRITNRIGNKLFTDKKRFIDTISHVPWYNVLPNSKNVLLSKFNHNFPKIKFIKLNLRDNFNELTWILPNYSFVAKVYLLNSNGIISSRSFRRTRQETENIVSRCVNNSVVCSGNIYTFLMKINTVLSNDEDDLLLGYRPMTRFPRKSYNAGVSFLLDKYKNILEPRNKKFSEVLDNLEYFLPQESKTNIAIYNTLNELV